MQKEIFLNRFLAYIKYNTQANPDSTEYPSNPKEKEFARFLVKELKNIGLEEVEMDKYGYVTATLPANIDNDKVPVVGFMAHIDTAPDMPPCAKPHIIENYQGESICLSVETNTILSPKDFPELNNYIGNTILCTDGKSLLGADDKAGVVEIIGAMEYLISHPEIKHGKIRVAFTLDEEIGKGVSKFDISKFGCDYAYTLDGSAVGELEYENFNACKATLIINGSNIHPGYAKDKMINSQLIASEIIQMFPNYEVPEHTENREGFYLLTNISGSIEQTTLTYIIRGFSKEKFHARKDFMYQITGFINYKYGHNTVNCQLLDQYYNMRMMIEPVMFVVDIAKQAMIDAGVKPVIQPIRGGTDGARLSFRGLPCPNIFAGGHNFHGKYEYLPLESMIKAAKVVVNIVQQYGIYNFPKDIEHIK